MPRAPTDKAQQASKRRPAAGKKSARKAAAGKAAARATKAPKAAPEIAAPSTPPQPTAQPAAQPAARRGAGGGDPATAQSAERPTQASPTAEAPAADPRPTITTILWTIYLNPADAPGQAVLRPHACLRDGRVLAGTRSWIRPTVAACRALIPKSAKRLNVADPDKTIQEVWMQTMAPNDARDQTAN